MTIDLAQMIIAAAAAIAAAGYLLNRGRIAARKLDRLDELLNRLDELDDIFATVRTDVPAMAIALGQLQGQVAELLRRHPQERP